MKAPKIRTMEEFATVSGISRPTVSKYFHDPSSVRATTRARIEQALEQYDYRPNVYAMNQNRRLTKNIGIVVPYLSDPFFAEIARHVETSCIDAGFSPTLFSAHGDTDLENDILDTLRSMRPAGVFLAPLGRRSDRAALENFSAEVPTVLFDSEMEGIGEAFVGSNNFQSIGLIVDYLCRTGEPPALFEMRAATNPNSRKRRAAYTQAMETLGHEPQVIQAAGEGWDFEEIGFREGCRVIAGKALQTDTVLCSNDRLAIGFLAAAFEMGLRVGRGAGFALRVAGHDDHPFSRYTSPSLTTVSQDYASIAEKSVETLFRRLESERPFAEREVTLYDGRLVMRRSA